jgi:hypothetical protein
MVLSMMRIPGNPDQLVAKVRETIAPVAQEKAPQYGGISSTVVKTGDGIMIVNLWETEEGRHQMADDPDIQRALREAGFPPPGFEAFEVLEHYTPTTAGVSR